MENIYDQEAFFQEYAKMARSVYGLEAAGEWQQLRNMLPDVTGTAVLDLGCGYGWHCSYLAAQGAASVLGIDSSRRMLAVAREQHAAACITYRQCGIEDYEYPEGTYDLVISNLALHYLEDLTTVYHSVYATLKPGGVFLFNIEHPSFTAGVGQDWIYDDAGTPLYWPIDNYYYPGPRTSNFLGKPVLKFHHTLSQILNPLISIGFTLTSVEEAMPPEEMLVLPGWSDEMRRPMMLLVKAEKH